jgi:hypothetical protein
MKLKKVGLTVGTKLLDRVITQAWNQGSMGQRTRLSDELADRFFHQFGADQRQLFMNQLREDLGGE